jgi:hypothetical protein
MSDTSPSDPATEPEATSTEEPEHVQPDEVTSGLSSSAAPSGESVPSPREQITAPAKVMRIGSMVKQLLEEVRAASLDEASRERLAEIYERSLTELSGALSPDLQEELRTLALPFDDDVIPSEAELRVAKAQLVGWLEGLFHGIQAALMAQQAAANQQLEGMRQLPGSSTSQLQQTQPQPEGTDRPGTYL